MDVNPYAPPKAPVDPAEPMPAEAVLAASFSNSLKDLMLFQVYITLRGSVMQLALLGLGTVATIDAWPHTGPGAIGAISAAIHGAWVVLICLVATFLFILIHCLVHRDRNFYRPRTIELTDSAVWDTTDMTQMKVKWPAIHGVTQTPWGIYIRLAPGMAHSIPRRAFADADSFLRFAGTAVHRFESSRTKGA